MGDDYKVRVLRIARNSRAPRRGSLSFFVPVQKAPHLSVRCMELLIFDGLSLRNQSLGSEGGGGVR